MNRKRYTKEFKAKVALEAVKSQKTVNKIASEFGVHVSQINEWKRQLLAGSIALQWPVPGELLFRPRLAVGIARDNTFANGIGKDQLY